MFLKVIFLEFPLAREESVETFLKDQYYLLLYYFKGTFNAFIIPITTPYDVFFHLLLQSHTGGLLAHLHLRLELCRPAGPLLPITVRSATSLVNYVHDVAKIKPRKFPAVEIRRKFIGIFRSNKEKGGNLSLLVT